RCAVKGASRDGRLSPINDRGHEPAVGTLRSISSRMLRGELGLVPREAASGSAPARSARRARYVQVAAATSTSAKMRSGQRARPRATKEAKNAGAMSRPCTDQRKNGTRPARAARNGEEARVRATTPMMRIQTSEVGGNPNKPRMALGTMISARPSTKRYTAKTTRLLAAGLIANSGI